MPSSHSSMVTALATAIGFKYGISSPVFLLSLFYGLIIIRDAVVAGSADPDLLPLGYASVEKFHLKVNARRHPRRGQNPVA